jgi:hypothetical protein
MGEQIGSAAVTGLGMLNPQRWTGGGAGAAGNGYRTPAVEKDVDGGLLFEIEEEDEKKGGGGDDGFGEMQMAKEPEPWGDEKRRSEVLSSMWFRMRLLRATLTPHSHSPVPPNFDRNYSLS